MVSLDSLLGAGQQLATKASAYFGSTVWVHVKPHLHHAKPVTDVIAQGAAQASALAKPHLAKLTPHIEHGVESTRTFVNEFFAGQEPIKIAAVSILAAFLFLIALGIALDVLAFALDQLSLLFKHGPFRYFGNAGMQFIKLFPFGRAMIDKESAKSEKKMAQMVLSKHDQGVITAQLPALPMPEEALFAKLREWAGKEEAIWATGQVSGTVYHGQSKLKDITNKAYSMFSVSNPLHPDVFPYVRKMEAEVISMSLSLFHANLEEAGGTTTSGGTESILMACKTHRDWARAEKGITEPEMVVPETIHAAFDKAAAYFGIKLVKVPVNTTTFRANVSAMKRACNSNTIMIAASAPCYAQGVIDPIAELAAFAKSRDIGMHVDACLGGFLLPFLELNGHSLPLFDFRVPGVTSISADLHKYGYTPKGVSVVMYASRKLRRYQYFVAAEWTGGIYASPTIAGSRPGGVIVAAWAALMSMGQREYQAHALKIMAAATEIATAVPKIKGLKLLGKPDMSVICFASDDKAVDVYKVAEAMGNRHWNLNSLQYPSCVHICLTYLHHDKAQKFIADLTESVHDVRTNPKNYRDGSAAIYGLAASIPDKSIVDELARAFIDTLFKTQA